MIINSIIESFLKVSFSELEISEKERNHYPYLSLNKFLDKLIEGKENCEY